jgi:sugar lactone lactonase YvrE
VSVSHELELLVDARAEVGEGPVWDDARERLLWVDILAGRLHTCDPVTGDDSWRDVGQPLGAVGLRARGGLVLALRDGFALLEPSGELRLVAEVEADVPANRMNDGACDRAGRFWAGTMAFDPVPGAGSLYRLDPDLTVTKVLGDVTISNGVGWSPDDRTMYYVDSPTQSIDAFDYDAATGVIENRRALVAVPEELGFADGLTVDAEGFLWVAVFGGGRLHRYAPDGSLERTVRLPVEQPTKPAFGGPGLAELYVTSAWHGLSDAERERQPSAGGVLRLRPGVSGVVANRFGG